MGITEVDLEQVSIILVCPRQCFLDWLSLYLARSAYGFSLEYAYHERENWAYIVPSLGALGSEEAFDRYLRERKPAMLRAELLRFPGAIDHFPVEVSADAFDQYLELTIRDFVGDSRALPIQSA